MKTQEKSVVIDKNYVPRVGDVLSNVTHPLVIVERVYALPKRSLRVNRNYYDQLFKHELIKKVIEKREIIWEQHKNDLKLFPEVALLGRDHTNTLYKTYLFYNDRNRHERLYRSKYAYAPNRKIRVITGFKTMVRLSHGLCRYQPILSHHEQNDQDYYSRACPYWYGKHATALSYLINNQFIYCGNINTDILQPIYN